MKHPITLTVSMVFFILLAGCGGGDGGGGGGEQGEDPLVGITAPVPELLIKKIASGVKVTANAELENGSVTQLTANTAGDSLQGDIFHNTGQRGVKVTYFLDGVKVAEVDTEVTVNADSSIIVVFERKNLRYLDSDGDGFTTLAELERGTDYEDFDSHPKPTGQAASQSYTLEDAAWKNPSTGLNLVLGRASSRDYDLH